jgi:hypothetical protein
MLPFCHHYNKYHQSYIILIIFIMASSDNSDGSSNAVSVPTGTIDATKFREYVKLARLIVSDYSEVRSRYFTDMDMLYVFGGMTPDKYRQVCRKFTPIFREIGTNLGYYAEKFAEQPYLYTINHILEYGAQFDTATELVTQIGNYLKSIPNIHVDHIGDTTRRFIQDVTPSINLDFVFTPSIVMSLFDNGKCNQTIRFMLTCIAMQKRTSLVKTTFTLREIFELPIFVKQRVFIPFIINIMKDFFAANTLLKIRSGSF